jgi:two-component SAPR family response regulator
MDARLPPTTILQGCRVLIVEDQFLLAEEMSAIIRGMGAEVVGPFATTAASLRLLADASVDLAILDINLDGEQVYVVAQELRLRNIPFFFATGYEPWVVSLQFQDAPHLEKPVNSFSLIQAIGKLDPPLAGSTP